MELSKYVTSNINSIYAQVRHLYQLEIEANRDPDTTTPDLSVADNKSTVLNRATRQWMFRVLKQMAKDINTVVTFYNTQGLRDIETDAETAPYSLSLPRSLELRKIKAVLDDDFKRANKLLDTLGSYTDIYLK